MSQSNPATTVNTQQNEKQDDKLSSLTELLQSTSQEEQSASDTPNTKRRGRPIPPLHKWHPERCGAMDLVIKANGEWWHEGSKITRQSLVDLFATVLWKEENNGATHYYLKTPVEKIGITVEDVPFLVNQVFEVTAKDDTGEQVTWLEFETSTGDVVRLDDEHQIVMRRFEGQDKPYIPIRFGMFAVLSRSVYMHLTELGEMSMADGITTLTLQSGKKSYKLTVSE